MWNARGQGADVKRDSSAHASPVTRALGAVLLSGVAGVVVAASPAEWLANMERALSSRNYTGVFVHEQRGQTETLQIVHRASSGRSDERIRSLDGSGREFIRRGGELTCYLPDQRLVVVEPARDGNLLLGELRRLDVAASGQYELRELAPTRVSGRDVRVLDVEPRDSYRYGYRLWIDAQSAMPLKSQLRAPRGEVLEQMVFTELRLPKQIADADLAPATDASGFRWARQPVSSVAAVNAVSDDAQGVWQSAALPPGFRMTLRAQQTLPGSNGPVTQWVFSDGLASVSVFVEQGAAVNAPNGADAGVAATSAAAAGDITQLGSSSAWSTTVQGYRVTAIGEVPPDTLRAIASSMAPAAAHSHPMPAAAFATPPDVGIGPGAPTAGRSDGFGGRIAPSLAPVAPGLGAGGGRHR
jgi:sigma-E factor negative regulatory protein RseB